MPEYATRTCHKCGARHSQEFMHKTSITVKAGESKRSVSSATFLGAFLGINGSKNAITSWIFNNNGRVYTRVREVWECDDCHVGSDINIFGKIKTVLNAIVIMSFVVVIIMKMFGH